jgi:hypothetical protein
VEEFLELCRKEGVEPENGKLMYRSGMGKNTVEACQEKLGLSLKDLEGMYLQFRAQLVPVLTDILGRSKK